MSVVRVGPRDLWAVGWIAEMRGIPMDVLAALVGTSETNAYRLVCRWRKANLVAEDAYRPVPGPQWVVPTQATASALLGFYVQPWIPGPKDANHLAMTARARIALAGNEPCAEDHWVSERLLRRHDSQRPVAFGGERPHLHDGQWTDDLGRVHAIEIELTRKGSADLRTTITAAYDQAKKVGAHDLIYYCETEEITTRVQAAAEAVLRVGPKDPGFLTRDLHTLINPPKKTEDTEATGGLSAAGGAA